jgi:hypothetical protein
LARGHGIIHGWTDASLRDSDGKRHARGAGSFIQVIVIAGYPTLIGAPLNSSERTPAIDAPASDHEPTEMQVIAGLDGATSSVEGADVERDGGSGWTLEDELRGLLSQVGDARAARFAALRWGWDGGQCQTLEAIGDREGLTRERVRQILQRLEESVRDMWGSSTPAPLLEEALDLVGKNLPTTVHASAHMLHEAGLTRGLIQPEALMQAAALLQRHVPFTQVELRDTLLLIPSTRNGADDDEVNASAVVEIIESVWRTAESQIRRRGATQVRAVAKAVAANLEEPPHEEQVTGLLACRADFAWLDKRGGWFWLKDVAKNSVLARIEKVLSIAEAVEVDDLLEGIMRDERMRDCDLSARLLEKLCSQCDDLVVAQSDGSTVVKAVSPMSAEAVMTGAELKMVMILKDHGPVLTSDRFRELSEHAGVAPESFYNRTRYSPIIREIGGREFCLRGYRQVGEAEAVSASRNAS